MSILRQYVAPLLVVLIFFIALVAVSARIFLPSDMAAPAPIEEDGEIGRGGEGGIGGEITTLSPYPLVSFSPCLLVTASPTL